MTEQKLRRAPVAWAAIDQRRRGSALMPISE
jgi:hypothetical protein